MILKVEFDEQVWSKIVDMLTTQPYKDVGPIIASLAQQFQEQQQRAPQIQEQAPMPASPPPTKKEGNRHAAEH